MGTFLVLLGLITDSVQVVRVQKHLLYLLGGWAGTSTIAAGAYLATRSKACWRVPAGALSSRGDSYFYWTGCTLSL